MTHVRLISCDQVENVIAALDHAFHLGLLPTHHITVDWDLAGVTDPVKATGRLLKLIKDALRRLGHHTAHIWVQEQGRVLGRHVHILVHLPTGRPNWLARRLPGWLKKCGAMRRQGVCKSRKIQGSGSLFCAFEPVSEYYQQNLMRLTTYLLKHCDEEASGMIGRRSIGPAHIVGKHVSLSQNIGPAARQRCQDCVRQSKKACSL